MKKIYKEIINIDKNQQQDKIRCVDVKNIFIYQFSANKLFIIVVVNNI